MYLTTNTLRIGVLTSGGDAPGMNAIIAGACDRAEHLGGHAHGIHGGFAGLAELRSEPIGAVEARAHLHESGTWLGTSRWPSLRSPEGRRVCADALEALALDGLVVIGGNGSAMGAAALADRIPVAFVPATIDRDISGTDVTVGMDSAVGYAVDTIDRLRVTGRSLRGRAFLVQTLGAPNGFLADAVASAAGIDHVLVPEREHDLDEIAVALRELALEGSAIAVMSEAIGDAVRVSEELAQRAGIRVHPTILGHAQRAATPSAQDRTLGQAAGRAAVDALAQGRSSFIALSAAGAVKSADLVAGIGPATPSITPETKERSHEPRL